MSPQKFTSHCIFSVFTFFNKIPYFIMYRLMILPIHVNKWVWQRYWRQISLKDGGFKVFRTNFGRVAIQKRSVHSAEKLTANASVRYRRGKAASNYPYLQILGGIFYFRSTFKLFQLFPYIRKWNKSR